MRTILAMAVVLVADVTDAVPINLSRSGDWWDDEKLLARDTFVIVDWDASSCALK